MSFTYTLATYKSKITYLKGNGSIDHNFSYESSGDVGDMIVDVSYTWACDANCHVYIRFNNDAGNNYVSKYWGDGGGGILNPGSQIRTSNNSVMDSGYMNFSVHQYYNDRTEVFINGNGINRKGSTGNLEAMKWGGYCNLAATIDSIQIFSSAGNISYNCEINEREHS